MSKERRSELIKSIRPNAANFDYIAKSPHQQINGSLFADIDRLMKKYAEECCAEKDLIISTTCEGSGQWKSEYDSCRTLLSELIYLKSIEGIEEYKEEYENRKQPAWSKAKKFIAEYQHFLFT